jgi:putative transposase
VGKLIADHGFSERRACRLIGVNRSAWQYEPLRGGDDDVRARMREIANERRRFGYRRLAILLKREGKGMNLKKVYRLYREERLTVRKRGGRKRALGTRAPMAIPQEPNQRWSLDFVSDSLACGRRFRECQDFRVWAGIMGKRESQYVATQRACDTERASRPVAGWRRCQRSV